MHRRHAETPRTLALIAAFKFLKSTLLVVLAVALLHLRDPDTFAHGILHSSEGIVGRFCGSAELDALVVRARSEIDPARRHELYRAIEETVAREALVMPLFHEQVYRFARPEVEGLDITFSTPPVVAYEKLWVRR